MLEAFDLRRELILFALEFRVEKLVEKCPLEIFQFGTACNLQTQALTVIKQVPYGKCFDTRSPNSDQQANEPFCFDQRLAKNQLVLDSRFETTDEKSVS